jgi:putative MATE family efflux protein
MTGKELPYKNKGDLTNGPVLRHLLRLSLPMTWGIMATISLQLVDIFYISLLGTRPLAAISFTFPLTMIIFSLLMGFSIAMASVASRLIGEGKKETVQRVTSHALLLVFFLSLALSAIGIFSHDFLFNIMGANEELLPLIRDYMHIWFGGIAFMALPLVGNAAIRAGGDTATPAMIMTGAALLNVILAPLLIFGLLGFPRLEMQGAAIATVISNGVAALAGIYVLAVREKFFSLSIALRQLHEFGDSARRLLFIALPAGITSTIQPLVNGVIVALLSAYGAESVAAFGVAMRVEAFAFIILMGLAVGMAPIIGQNWGAGKFGRVHEALRLAIGFSIFWSLSIALMLNLFAQQVAGIFSADPVVIYYAGLFFAVVPLSYAFSNLIAGWGSAFNAMGMPRRALMMIVVKSLVLMIPAVYAGAAWGGVKGIFLAIAAVNFAAGTFFHFWSWRYLSAGEERKTQTA